jgi:hypothetical protein
VVRVISTTSIVRTKKKRSEVMQPADWISADIIDKTTNFKRLVKTPDSEEPDFSVPALEDTVPDIKNICAGYIFTESGPNILPYRAHTQGDLFFSTVTTYEVKGTAVYPQELIQLRRKVRNTKKPHKLAKGNPRPTCYNNIVPNWLKRFEWDHKIFYPKVGNSILKRRKFPLDRTQDPRYHLKFEFLDLPLQPFILGADPKSRFSVFTFLQFFWVPGLTFQEVLDSRPPYLDYIPPVRSNNNKLRRKRRRSN